MIGKIGLTIGIAFNVAILALSHGHQSYGYEVRGKTPAEIRAVIKRAPRRKANQVGTCDDGVQDKRKKVA